MNDTLFGIHEAAAFLGVKHDTIRRMIRKGLISYLMSGQSYLFKQAELERVKAEQYPEGMSHSDIAREYVVGRTTIIEQFKRLKVEPMGIHRGRNGAKLYSPSTVATFSRLLGWDRRHKNPTDE